MVLPMVGICVQLEAIDDDNVFYPSNQSHTVIGIQRPMFYSGIYCLIPSHPHTDLINLLSRPSPAVQPTQRNA